jgi:hypothetical protein
MSDWPSSLCTADSTSYATNQTQRICVNAVRVDACAHMVAPAFLLRDRMDHAACFQAGLIIGTTLSLPICWYLVFLLDAAIIHVWQRNDGIASLAFSAMAIHLAGLTSLQILDELDGELRMGYQVA